MELIVSGDDSFVGSNSSDLLHRMVDVIRNFSGMDIEVAHIGPLDGTEFCKAKFTTTKAGRAFAYHSPGAQLWKLGIRVDFVENVCSKSTYDYMKAKILSCMAMNYGLPICRFLNALLQKKDKKPTFKLCVTQLELVADIEYKIMNVHQYLDDEIEWYEERYGEEIDKLVAMVEERLVKYKTIKMHKSKKTVDHLGISKWDDRA